MAAAEIKEYFYGQPAAHDVKTGSACKVLMYSGTKVTKGDWLILGDFTDIRGACPCVFADTTTGTYFENICTTTATGNALFLNSDNVGAFSIIVWGE